MAEPENQPASSTERTPLLGNGSGQEAYHPSESETRTKKAARWLIDHAVILCVTLLLVAVIVILGVFLGVYRSNKPSTESQLCLTPACIHASSEILHNLSPNYQNIDPCTDFEQLTCGGWSERHDLRPDQGDAFTGTFMGENSQTLLRHILEAPYPQDSKHSSFSPAQLVKTFASADQDNFNKLKAAYDACMDEERVKKVGVKPLLEHLHQVADLYPLEKSKSKQSDLSDTILHLAKHLAVTGLVSLGANADDKDPDVVVVQIDPPYSIGLPAKDHYSDNDVVQKYENTLAQIIENIHPLSAGNGNNHSTVLAHDVVEFEKLLAAASPNAEDRNDVTKYYNPLSLKDATMLAPEIDLAKIINNLAPANVKTSRVIVKSPQYLRDLSKILSNTSRDILQTYFIWKVIQNYASVVEAEEIKPYSRFSNELEGKNPESTSERWRTCVTQIDNAYDPNAGLGWILSRFFVEKAFSESAKQFGDQIVSDIKDQFIEKLKSSDWMDADTKKLAIEKVHQIIQKIGYPTNSPNIMNAESLKKFYESVDISSSTFFKNTIELNRFGVAAEWSTLGKPVDKNAWQMTVPTVNAYYNPPGNEIVFPAGIMQFPVFDVNLPQYLSYGAFGSVSGHELSHAFDSTGRHYDQNGNYTDWWTDKTVAGFTQRADCFVDQYHNYTIPGPDDKPLHVNGKLTLGENIADAGGVAAAFAAWKKRQKETPNQDLPGLEAFTQEQLFFVGYGSWWCGKSRKGAAISRIYTDPHAPKWARILGTMANSKDFKEAFSCPVKEPVCELW